MSPSELFIMQCMYTPVVYDKDEFWQVDRCLFAISKQPVIKEFISLVEKERPRVIAEEMQKYNKKLFELDTKYESIKSFLDNDIKVLQEMGISIEGSQHKLSKVNINSNSLNQVNLIETKETFGRMFKIRGGQPIKLNKKNLHDKNYFNRRYLETNPDSIIKDYNRITKKMKKYLFFGKFLKGLLKTDSFFHLEIEADIITEDYENCILRKKEMQSSRLLDRKKIMAIELYLNHLSELCKISEEIKHIFYKIDISSNRKDYHNFSNFWSHMPYDENNLDPASRIYDLTIKKILLDDRYNELVDCVQDYIKKILNNDEETMKEVNKQIYGRYIGEFPERYIYKLLIDIVPRYNKKSIEDRQKQLKSGKRRKKALSFQ